MPSYQFKAVEKSGKPLKGVILADNPERVKLNLRDKGVYLTHIKEMPLGRFRRGLLRQKLLFYRELGSFLRGGKTLDQALELVWQTDTSRDLKPVIADLKERVHRGESLAKAMQSHPLLFSSFDWALVRTGEESGSLPATLKLISGYLQKEESLRSEIRSALAYPLFVALFSFLTVLALFAFVIPALEDLYSDLGGGLPFITQTILGLSLFLQANGIWMALLLLGAFIFCRLPQTKARLKKAFAQWVFKIPKVGEWISLREGGRFCATMATLVGSGMSLVRSLETATDIFKNEEFKKAIQEIKGLVVRGASLGKTLEQYPIFPNIISSLVRSGEESGNLKEQFAYLGEVLEEDSTAKLKFGMTFLEPALIVCVGIIIGIVVLAVILPIVQLNEMIS